MEFSYCQILLVALIILALQLQAQSSDTTKHFKFNVEWKTVSRLCHTKKLLTVNGKYPGPTIAVNEGDNVLITVTNRVATNTTLHWHGVRQLRTGWADGPAYVTQCPIGQGNTYTYNFTVVDQRGTLWWHAHYSWQRATVYGAFIIYPRMPFPFSSARAVETPSPIIFGEWWNADVDAVEKEMTRYGGGPNSSDAYTINGLPGPLYPCSIKDTFIQTVEHGKTYLLRIINAALNQELFFAVANHTLTVVEIDATYTKPLETPAILITPGQTTTVLLTAGKFSGEFVMAARPYLTSVFPFDNSTTIGFLKYTTKPKTTTSPNLNPKIPILPTNLPPMEDTPFATRFINSLRSLASKDYPCNVPRSIDKRVVTTVSLNLQDCPKNQTCKGYRNKRFFASMNNQSFIRPSISILQSHYHNLKNHFSSDFPERPPHVFNYTGIDPVAKNMNTEFGTKVLEVDFGTKLEIVLQDTNFLNPENHPIHVHGHNFFIVGRGFGNFNAAKDTKGYNLVDPPERNTVAVPVGGWAAIRINADNPGVWFIHCHLEEHTSWGLAMGFVVKSGKDPDQCLIPPPNDLPPC